MTSPATTEAQAGDVPGTVLESIALVAPGEVEAAQILYRSTGMDGAPIEVSGWVAVSPAPGPHPVLVYAHGTRGLGDECAPSTGGGLTPHHFADYLDAGWSVAFTDYQGLGTPGLHHYLVAEAEARSLLDIARAARNMDPDASTDVALLGFSQGGHAVLSAAEWAGELAPELSVAHTVAAAPAVLLREWYAEAPEGQLAYLAMIGLAYADAYDTPLEVWLGDEAVAVADVIAEGCLFEVQQAVGGLGSGALSTNAPEGSHQGDLLDGNEPATVRLDSPVLLITGGQDDLFGPDVTARLVDRMCGLGTDVGRIHFPGATHTQLAAEARAAALTWIDGDGDVAERPCEG